MMRGAMMRGMAMCGVLLGCWSAVACGNLVGDATLPPGTQSPDTYNTPEGAVAMYRGVKSSLVGSHDFVTVSGLLADELQAQGLGNIPGAVGATGDPIDERVAESSNTDALSAYSELQQVRGSAAQAIGMLASYAPDTSPALRGEMYAIQGYAEMLLSELFCSGVPLSTVDFQADFTYKPGSSQTDVYRHALALFDSALAISSDSASVMAFAAVAKGRVLLDLGRYAEAGQAVASVPDTFRYAMPMLRTPGDYLATRYAVATSEGGNGLPFITANDPRVKVTAGGKNQIGVPFYRPAKYPNNKSTALIDLATGIEARLIEAEAALNANDPAWLSILNRLRTTSTTCTVETTPSCASTAPAGTGGVAGLPLLVDPGSDTARVTLLFTERAFWMFLTGHRQGDLRRLVRNYGRPQTAVYPTGLYFGGSGFYGTDVNLPIPDAEFSNPYFQGCLDRRA